MKCYVTGMRSMTRTQAHEVHYSEKFAGKKRGWHLKPRYFPISSILKKKMNFGNLKGAYKDSRVFF